MNLSIRQSAFPTLFSIVILFLLLLPTVFYAQSNLCLVNYVDYDVVNVRGDSFDIVLDADINNISDSFGVNMGGQSLGMISFGDLPMTFGPYTTVDLDVIIVLQEQLDSTCIQNLAVSLSDFCELSGLEVEVLDCNSNNTFDIIVNFNKSAHTSDNFILWTNGTNHGAFAYGDLPVRINNVDARYRLNSFVNVYDINNTSCGLIENFLTPYCDTVSCLLDSISVSRENCTDSTFELTIGAWQYPQPLDTFEFFYNGQSIGVHTLRFGPIDFGQFTRTGMVDTVKVINITDANCMFTMTIPVDDCFLAGVCYHTRPKLGIRECTSANTYRLLLDFNYGGSLGDTFLVKNLDGLVGRYAYADLPIEIPNYPNTLGGDYISISSQTGDCSNERFFEGPRCDISPICELFDFVYEIVKCAEGELIFELDFTNESSSDSFFVSVNNSDFGVHAYADLPTDIGPVDASNFNEYDVMIVDQESPDCNLEYELGYFYCDSSCFNYNPVAEAFNCTANSMYVELDFNYQHNRDSFGVFGSGQNFGHFNYNELPIEIGPIDLSSNVDILEIMDLDVPDCVIEVPIDSNCIMSSTTNVMSAANFEIRVFPGTWTISVDEISSLAIYNLSGQAIRKFGRVDQELLVTDLPHGIYIVSCTSPRGIFSQKAVFFSR